MKRRLLSVLHSTYQRLTLVVALLLMLGLFAAPSVVSRWTPTAVINRWNPTTMVAHFGPLALVSRWNSPPDMVSRYNQQNIISRF